jgi:hypothetical protein
VLLTISPCCLSEWCFGACGCYRVARDMDLARNIELGGYAQMARWGGAANDKKNRWDGQQEPRCHGER